MAYPQAILFFIVLSLNFVIARWLTIILLRNEYIKRDSIYFQRATYFWFAPIVGALGLLLLLWTYKFIDFWKWFSHWISLSHYKPVPVPIEQQLRNRDAEILERVERIKEQERLAKKPKKTKTKRRK